MKGPKDRLHKVIVIGATAAGIAATNKLGEIGIPVTLVDSEHDLDEKLSKGEYRLDSGMAFTYAHRPGILRILRNPSIQCMMPADVLSIKHNPQGFRVRLQKKPTYIDADRCLLCGKCVDVCPAISPDGLKAIQHRGRMGLPGRPFIDKRRQPLCEENCPLGVNVQGYIALTKAGRYGEALELIRQDNVLPGICGRICTHPCETECRRQELDKPIAIRDIKRFVADREIADGTTPLETYSKAAHSRSEKIAVVGSGPAGLAAAADLARNGYSVTVFEKEKKPGGFLRYAIGTHRLPREILDREIDAIGRMGVTFETDHAIDLQDGLSAFYRNFSAVLLATGAWNDRKLGVPGESLSGVEGCVSFLSRFYRNPATEIREKIAVIGDGNAAFDLAGVLKRLGAEVTLVSWFSEEDIPADPEEQKGAREEKITILTRLQVVEFAGSDNRLSTLICKPTKPGKPDRHGICWPILAKNSEPVELSFDRAIVAIGQTHSFANASRPFQFAVTSKGSIRTDDAFRTDLKYVYAAGDTVTGPSSVVQAMASARKAARTIHSDLGGEEDLSIPLSRSEEEYPPIPEDIPAMARPPMPERQPATRIFDFHEVALGLTESQVLFEAQRCLQCGICSQCLQCVEACGEIGAIMHQDAAKEMMEHAGVLIIADPDISPQVKGDDVIRAYGPKSAKPDVNAMVIRGLSAAARAMVLLEETSQRPKGYGISFHAPDPGLSPAVRMGIFVCRCNDSMGWMDEMTRYLEQLNEREDIAHVEILNSACIFDGYTQILRMVRDKGITRMVLASCVCCPLNFICSACTDQRSRLKNALFTGTGISRSMVETCNIRGEVLRLVGRDPENALTRFTGLMERSIERARRLKPLPALIRNYNFTTAVIGTSKAAMNSAMTLAEAGLEVFLFSSNSTDLSATSLHQNIHVLKDAVVKSISGNLGEFRLLVQRGDFEQNLQFGSVILGEKARSKINYVHQHEMPSRMVTSTLQKAGKSGLPFFAPGSTSIKGLYLADPPGIHVSKRKKGESAAVSAAALMPRGPRQSKGFTVVVHESLCRGCGRCASVCPYQAIRMHQNDLGGWYAVVNETICKGCGNCISNCPSNAADSPYRDRYFLEQTIEEVLVNNTSTIN
ncbi:MAG: FAD-dependent oxidoreductase [Desulfobacterales bacterium]